MRKLVKSRATDHGIAVAFRLIATAIPVRWWRLVAQWKGHNLRRQFGWSAADRADNNVADMAAPLAPSNLRRDSIAPAGAKRKVSNRLT